MLWFGMPYLKLPEEDAKPDILSCARLASNLASSLSMHILIYLKAVDTLHLMVKLLN